MTVKKNQVANFRKQYALKKLDEKNLDPSPINFFEKWLKEAYRSGMDEPNAMTICSIDGEGFPDSRIVLLREVSDKGFVFYTNYHSAKGMAFAKNARGAINFFWPELQRQVRIKGLVTKVPSAQSDAYFHSRPRESQVGAWASAQSMVLKSRKELEDNFKHFEKFFGSYQVPRPDHWGGYVLKPEAIEFWQGRPNRLHDRLRYFKVNYKWKIERLSP
jgi:pyridoxamine 5'-phosphate oxidase